MSPLLLALAACSGPDPVELDPTDDPTVVDTDVPVTDTEDTDVLTTPAGCVPTREAFETNAMPAIERNCLECHGEPTQFGAPWSVLDYDELVAGDAPDRKVDLMLERLLDRTMPPPTAGLMPHADLDTLVGWASCGLVHPDPSVGLEASQPVWEAPPKPPAGTTAVNLSANGHFVDVDDIDAYEYFLFGNLVNQDVFVRRMEAVIDESRVVHHITLHHLVGYDYLYTWAPGTGAIEFPDGGIRLRPNDGLIMEIHYNNGAGIADVYDSSGIRLWVGDTTGTEWGMAAPSVYDLDIPAGSSGLENSDTCRATMDFEILAGMPHMHEIGSTLEHVIERQDGTEETLIELSGWSFEAQYFYEMPAQIQSGDRLRLTCTYDNPHAFDVGWGEGTSDEMCFNFIYVTPPAAAFQCLF